MTTRALPLLENVTIASPCTVSWDEMSGDDRTRLCSHCNLHVHNLSAMTRDEAEALLATDEHMCIRLYQRADGTVITQDCPVGLAAARARMRRLAGRIAAAVGLMSAAAAAGVVTSQPQNSAPVRLRAFNPFAMFTEWLIPTPPAMPAAVKSRAVLRMGSRCN